MPLDPFKPGQGPQLGTLAPPFTGRTDGHAVFRFHSLGGKWIVLAFLGSLSVPAAAAAHASILAQRSMFDDKEAHFFGVHIDPADQTERGLADSYPGLRWFHDYGGDISRLYGAMDGEVYHLRAYLIDPQLRIAAAAPISGLGGLLDRLRVEVAADRLTRDDAPAPVLTVPRIFEPELCAALIDYYRVQGGAPSGFMREEGGRTVGIKDDRFKRRADAIIEDPDLLTATRERISYRLIPAIDRFLGWRATRIERYIVARYGADEGGFFRAHRDNTTPGTAHRKFAVTLNLNAEDYEGGVLCFPEFGSRTYKPPTGGATVFCCSLLHEATPVTRGERFAFLPFLYDEAGRAVRLANAHSLAPAPEPASESAPVPA